ncbi:hypothetical protein Hanom_Chr06g00531171 [Helianthus anomalus]
MNETNKTLHQMLDDLHEASSNENKVLKLEIEALRADKGVKDGQLNMLYIVMEHLLGINIQAMYNDLEIQSVEERRAQREKELAEAATQKKKELIVETQEVGGSSSQHGGNDVEMVDAEVNAEVENMDVDQDQSFLLVGNSVSLPYSLNDVIQMVKVEQRKGKPSVQQSLDDFLNDELNEQVEDQHQESSSRKQHADQVFLTQPIVIYLNSAFEGELVVPRTREETLEELGLDYGNLKFDIEDEIPSSPERGSMSLNLPMKQIIFIMLKLNRDQIFLKKMCPIITLVLMTRFLHLLRCSKVKRKIVTTRNFEVYISLSLF